MSANSIPTRVVAIGVGGATSSGKTILAKHLRNCLHNSVIIHQDDFVPPAEKLPVDPEYGFADWDDAPGAIDWDRMSTFLSDLKKTGVLPEDHESFDSLNTTANVSVDDEIIAAWKTRSEKLASEHLEKYGEKLVWAIIDGFLLYWDKRIVTELDVRVFLRVPEDIAKKRREARAYNTPEGDVWKDPPYYWDKIVWPAYLRAHKSLFEGEDVVAGKLSGQVEDLILFESTKVEMKDMVDAVMKTAVDTIQAVTKT